MGCIVCGMGCMDGDNLVQQVVRRKRKVGMAWRCGVLSFFLSWLSLTWLDWTGLGWAVLSWNGRLALWECLVGINNAGTWISILTCPKKRGVLASVGL